MSETEIFSNELKACSDERTGIGGVIKEIKREQDHTKSNQLMSRGFLFVTKDSGAREEYKSGMRRDVQKNKPRYDLMYVPMLTRWANLMARGAEKYGERNWELAEGSEELDRFLSSAFRHFIQWFSGEDDGEDHAAAVFFNISAAEMVKEKLSTKHLTNK